MPDQELDLAAIAAIFQGEPTPDPREVFIDFCAKEMAGAVPTVTDPVIYQPRSGPAEDVTAEVRLRAVQERTKWTPDQTADFTARFLEHHTKTLT